MPSVFGQQEVACPATDNLQVFPLFLIPSPWPLQVT